MTCFSSKMQQIPWKIAPRLKNNTYSWKPNPFLKECCIQNITKHFEQHHAFWKACNTMQTWTRNSTFLILGCQNQTRPFNFAIPYEIADLPMGGPTVFQRPKLWKAPGLSIYFAHQSLSDAPGDGFNVFVDSEDLCDAAKDHSYGSKYDAKLLAVLRFRVVPTCQKWTKSNEVIEIPRNHFCSVLRSLAGGCLKQPWGLWLMCWFSIAKGLWMPVSWTMWPAWIIWFSSWANLTKWPRSLYWWRCATSPWWMAS